MLFMLNIFGRLKSPKRKKHYQKTLTFDKKNASNVFNNHYIYNGIILALIGSFGLYWFVFRQQDPIEKQQLSGQEIQHDKQTLSQQNANNNEKFDNNHEELNTGTELEHKEDLFTKEVLDQFALKDLLGVIKSFEANAGNMNNNQGNAIALLGDFILRKDIPSADNAHNPENSLINLTQDLVKDAMNRLENMMDDEQQPVQQQNMLDAEQQQNSFISKNAEQMEQYNSSDSECCLSDDGQEDNLRPVLPTFLTFNNRTRSQFNNSPVSKKKNFIGTYDKKQYILTQYQNDLSSYLSNSFNPIYYIVQEIESQTKTKFTIQIEYVMQSPAVWYKDNMFLPNTQNSSGDASELITEEMIREKLQKKKFLLDGKTRKLTQNELLVLFNYIETQTCDIKLVMRQNLNTLLQEETSHNLQILANGLYLSVKNQEKSVLDSLWSFFSSNQLKNDKNLDWIVTILQIPSIKNQCNRYNFDPYRIVYSYLHIVTKYNHYKEFVDHIFNHIIYMYNAERGYSKEEKLDVLTQRRPSQDCMMLGSFGTGKSSIVEEINKAVGLNYERINVSKIDDVQKLVDMDPSSSSQHYLHSITPDNQKPNIITQSIINIQKWGGIIHLDEFDQIPGWDAQTSLDRLMDLFDLEKKQQHQDLFLREIIININGYMIIVTSNQRISSGRVDSRTQCFCFDKPIMHFLSKLVKFFFCKKMIEKENFFIDIKDFEYIINHCHIIVSRHLSEKTTDLRRFVQSFLNKIERIIDNGTRSTNSVFIFTQEMIDQFFTECDKNHN